jgi:hypothetical protein
MFAPLAQFTAVISLPCTALVTCPQDARPLLAQSIKLVEEVTPLLKELREGGLVANVEALTSTAAAAAADIQKLQVGTPGQDDACSRYARLLSGSYELTPGHQATFIDTCKSHASCLLSPS